MCFVGNGNPKDYGAFGCIITSLKEKSWFMDYVTKWIWYNSDDGETEDDFAAKDVLYHYTKKLSAILNKTRLKFSKKRGCALIA